MLRHFSGKPDFVWAGDRRSACFRGSMASTELPTLFQVGVNDFDELVRRIRV